MWSHIYGLDIETDTTPETPQELAAGSAPGSRGLDPRIGAVTSIGIDCGDGEGIYLDGDEEGMLLDLQRHLRRMPVGLIATWNGSVFDLPFLDYRYRAHGLTPPFELHLNAAITPKYEPLPGYQGGYTAVLDCNVPSMNHAHLDVAYALRSRLESAGIGWRLKEAAHAAGIDMVTVDRTAIHTLSPSQQREYNLSDSRGTRELAVRLLAGTLTFEDAA